MEPFIPNNVYILTNQASSTVLDLSKGEPANGTQCQGWAPSNDNIYTFNQQWLVTGVQGFDGVYNLCNLRGVQGWSKATGSYVKNQQWKIFADSKGGYRLQNVVANAYLDLEGGNNRNGTKIQGYEYVDTPNQRWDLRRVSRTGTEIKEMVRANIFTPPDFGSFFQDGLYIVLPVDVRKDIYNNTGLCTTKWRREIFDCDHFAFAAKAAVAKWGNDNIRADDITIVFGVMFGRNHVDKVHAYNWYLTADLSGIIFFEPQNGNEMVDPGYRGYFGVF